MKRATSGRLQTQTARLGDGGSKWHTPVTVKYLEMGEHAFILEDKMGWCV